MTVSLESRSFQGRGVRKRRQGSGICGPFIPALTMGSLTHTFVTLLGSQVHAAACGWTVDKKKKQRQPKFPGYNPLGTT